MWTKDDFDDKEKMCLDESHEFWLHQIMDMQYMTFNSFKIVFGCYRTFS